MIHISVAQYAVRPACLIRVKDIDAGSIPQNAEGFLKISERIHPIPPVRRFPVPAMQNSYCRLSLPATIPLFRIR